MNWPSSQRGCHGDVVKRGVGATQRLWLIVAPIAAAGDRVVRRFVLGDLLRRDGGLNGVSGGRTDAYTDDGNQCQYHGVRDITAVFGGTNCNLAFQHDLSPELLSILAAANSVWLRPHFQYCLGSSVML